MDNAFQWIMGKDDARGGLCRESTFPYMSGGGSTESCSASTSCHEVVNIKDYHDVAKNELALQKAVAKTPVAIAVAVDEWTGHFQHYKSGVLSDCGEKYNRLNHGVLAAGYGTDYVFGDYWLVKNSWGRTWGEEGYIRIKRTANATDDGLCHLAHAASYAIGLSAQ